ncbi:MAG: hypothetical protein M1819_001902 [Sarea resinae]|nr:MAG: hypothetical protein M1819_001902 [Sarea resinae]
MALVDYSDSEESEAPSLPSATKAKIANQRQLKRKHDRLSPSDISTDLPPLPAAFHDLYASNTRVSTQDDPSLHGGRKRITPHVEGNWPTHLYLEWYPVPTESAKIDEILSSLEADRSFEQPTINSLLSSDLGAQLPLHVSLSRPVVLLGDQRQPFIDLFQTAVKRCGVRPFNVTPKSLDWVANYEGTRWFLVLRLEKPANDSLNRLLYLSNNALASFHQPPLYADPNDFSASQIREQRASRGRASLRGRGGRGGRGRSSVNGGEPVRSLQPTEKKIDFSSHFHISLGWSLNTPSPELQKRTRTVNLTTLLDHDSSGVDIRFDAVKAKIGNAVTVVPLPTKPEEGGGLIGL